MNNHPTGTVTFLFTDIEGSTKLTQGHPDKWESLQQRHHVILQSAIESHSSLRLTQREEAVLPPTTAERRTMCHLLLRSVPKLGCGIRDSICKGAGNEDQSSH